MPADLAYAALLEALPDDAEVRIKDLELYRGDQPPDGYGIELEIEGILREAEEAGFERFHLVGYSGGGAVSTAFTARHPDRPLSLSLLEPAWMGNRDLLPEEQRIRSEYEEIRALPPEEMMSAFVRGQLAPGVEPPPPPPGPPPPWMSKRPPGLRALMAAFDDFDLDPERLRAYAGPVMYVLGGKSNPDYYAKMAERVEPLFADFRVEVFEERHHFDPPHRMEPDRLAELLVAHWDRAGGDANRTG
jgi:pimeloyl-ACP methyl ester carboxylesterase